MNAAHITSHAAPGVLIEVVDNTGSTNADLLARLATLSGPTLLVAERQHAGRGRSGRAWLSAPEASLTFSLAWQFRGPLARLVGLPLAVGVALAEALASLDVPVSLKWPNDLLKDGGKLGGVLIEAHNAPSQPEAVWAVIGVGLNLLMPDELETRIGHGVACAPWLARMDRDVLMAHLLDALAAAARQFDQTGFAPFCARWNDLHAYQGQAVAIIERDEVLYEGIAAGVDAFGRLLLDTRDSRVEIVAGDVSLRVAR